MSEETLRQLVAAHRGVFDGLRDAVDGLDASGWATETGCPGWDVHDQIAHVIGVERTMLGDAPDEVELPDLPHIKNDFGKVVEVAIQARRGVSAEDLLQEADEVFARRLAVLEGLEPAALQEPMDGAAGLRLKGSQMLRLRVFDMVCHEHDIRRALGREGDTQGPHVDVSVEQVLRGWARALPPGVESGILEVVVADGPTARLDLADGTLHRDGEGPDPTATCHLDVGELLAIAAGRSDAPDPSQLRIDGDRDWVARALAGAAITP